MSALDQVLVVLGMALILGGWVLARRAFLVDN